MQHKWTVLLTVLVLLSLLLTPVGGAHAARAIQSPVEPQGAPPHCPPYQQGLLQEQAFLDSLPPECVRAYKDLERQANPLEGAAADPGPAAVSAPDSFGYTYDNTVTYAWVSAATNSGLTGDDQFSGPVDIGFPFPFYGSPQTQLYFSTNGLITFGAGTTEWNPNSIPNDRNPNHLIAAFWGDLLVGSPYNGGGIYYTRGGSAPNRFIVIEWRGVETYEETGVFAFEAILYENGNILIQHRSRPGTYFSSVGIEDSSGYQGLQYQYGSNGIVIPRAIRFNYPPASAARVLAFAMQRGGFVPLNSPRDFAVTVKNTGSLGTDTYDLTLFASSWPVSFYASNGLTPLSDTDGDSVIDTGPLAQGASTTVIARYRVPVGAMVGDSNLEQLRFASSVNPAVTATVSFSMSVPAGFANVFLNNTDGAMSLLTVSSGGTKLSKATADGYFGSALTVTRLTNGNYLYAWDKSYSVGSIWVQDIEYALLDRQGTVIRAPGKLTNNSGATLRTLDGSPSLAVAPNGTVGMVWVRYLYNSSTDKYNYNVFFATLNAAGTLLTGPTSITDNTVWGNSSSSDIPEYDSPTIAASSDNRFIIAWEYDRRTNSTLKHNIWMAVRTTAGASFKSPTDLVSDGTTWGPVLNPLAGGRVILTWLTETGGPYYLVLNSGGSIYKTATSLGAVATHSQPDAIQLPNGKAAVAWGTDSGVQFSLLNSSYNIESGPYTATSAYSKYDNGLSVTTDASSRVIMTWINGDGSNKQLYALGGSLGGFLTAPMIYNASRDPITVSWNGQGNAPYTGDPVISGNAGVAGATLQYPGGSTTSDGSGNYSITVPLGWAGSVTPSKSGYIFSPTRRTYSNVTTDQTTQNYIATPFYVISGNAGASQVTLSYTNVTARTVTSQPNGNYSFVVPANWSGTVTPSHTCFTFSPASLNYSSVSSDQTAQNYNASIKAGSGCADVDVSIVGIQRGRYGVPSQSGSRASFAGADNGPVKVESTNAVPIIGAERLIYKVNGVGTSFSEMMGLPDGQLDNIYWLPWYNNVDLDTQLRFANVSATPATVHISIGGVEMATYSLAPGASTRKSFPGIDKGPVKIQSNVNIVAAERVIYKAAGGVATSFSETMALPGSQLDTIYWLPWYNNVDLDTQLRFANVSNTEATVHVTINGVEMTGSPFALAAGASTRKSFTGIDKGPVKIESNVNIVAAERVIYKVNNIATSFSEMLALPNSQLNTNYVLPWYNNVDLDTQLRFANVSATDATVHVTIGGVEVTGSPFTLTPGASIRKSFPGIDRGPVQIESNVDIVVAGRVIYKVNNIATSFSEMMGLPASQLDTIYWLPWYNNVDLDTQLRFAAP